MNGVKERELKSIVAKKPSDFDIENLIINLKNYYRWHGHDLPPFNPSYVAQEEPAEPQKPVKIPIQPQEPSELVCECLHYDRGKTTRYYSDGSQRIQP